MNQPVIPSFMHRMFKWFCKRDLFEELQGDLEEAFYENVEEFGEAKAKAIYKREILKMIRPSVMKNMKIIPSGMSRLPRNYIKTSIRAIRLNPFYIAANVFGLALALSICTIGYFNYQYNATFNKYFENHDDLYKIHGERIGKTTVGQSPAPLAAALRADGINAMRYTQRKVAVRLQKRLFNENTGFADPEFFKSFEFKSLTGKPLAAPSITEIVISESTALKLFSEPYPAGQLVHLVFPDQEERSFTIKDVFEKLPANISFFPSIMLSTESYFQAYDANENDWSEWVDGTFVQLSREEKAQFALTLDKYLEIQNKANPELEISQYRSDNILDWPALESSFYRFRFRDHLHSSSVAGIAGSAIAILLLACFNFINTSIALSGKRLKEVAVRKILGGSRQSTIVQFMIENALMISVAVILSFGISVFLIPSYNTLFRQEIIDFANIPFEVILSFSAILILVVTVLSGAYPALHVSKFPPLVIFREKVILSGKNRLMSILLTFQFALCFYNVFAFYLLVDNAEYQETLDRGYEVTQAINVPLNRPEQFAEFRDLLVQNPNVLSVAGSESLIGFSNEDRFVDEEGVNHPVALLKTGTNYPETLGLRLSQGAFFSNEKSSNEVVINQMLQDQIERDLLNQQINLNGEKMKVVGIVDDFNLRSIIMDNKIVPTVIRLADDEQFRYASVRVQGNALEMEGEIEQTWYDLFPKELYTGFMQESVMDNVRETNKIMILINVFLGVISILISVLGLYTLIALTVQRRSKEFGVRKVLGASRGVIVGLLGRNLIWILSIASIVGLTASYYVLSIVFDIIYAYHISADVLHFTKAIFSVVIMVMIAVGYKVYQTGRMNPVQQLRTE